MELADLARKHGRLTDPATDQVVEVLSKVRTMAAHPGAYVRRMPTGMYRNSLSRQGDHRDHSRTVIP